MQMHQKLQVHSPYICPRSKAQLEQADGALHAQVTGATYPVRNGIPQFLRFAPAEDARTDEELRRLNEVARSDGWRNAIMKVYGHDDRLVTYVTDEKRTSFLELLPLTKDSAVLEIGPGLGQITTAIARRVKSVHALEIVAGQAEFAAERCRQEQLANVQFAVGGDDCRLPYLDESFDVVVLNLVFEWCARRCTEEQFEAVQQRLLDEMFRVLKPGGSLYLTTKNRFSLHNLLGKADEHCHDMRFGSALPKGLRAFLMKRRGHNRPLGVLYSHDALQKMLLDTGFVKADSFWATPEMRYPTQYVPTGAAAVRRARSQAGFVQGENRRGRWLMRWIPAAFVKHFTPGLAFLAGKASK